MGFLKILRIRLAQILVNAGQSCDRIDVIRIALEHVFERLNCQLGVLVVVFGAATRNVLLRICRRQIDLGSGEIRIQLDRLLEVIHSILIVGISEGADAFVRVVTRLQLCAAC